MAITKKKISHPRAIVMAIAFIIVATWKADQKARRALKAVVCRFHSKKYLAYALWKAVEKRLELVVLGSALWHITKQPSRDTFGNCAAYKRA